MSQQNANIRVNISDSLELYLGLSHGPQMTALVSGITYLQDGEGGRNSSSLPALSIPLY